MEQELGYPVASQRLYLHNQELQDSLEVKDLVPQTISFGPAQPQTRLGK